MEFGYNARPYVELERGKFGSIWRDDDHFKRPPCCLPGGLTFFVRISRVVKLYAKQRGTYVHVHAHPSFRCVYICTCTEDT